MWGGIGRGTPENLPYRLALTLLAGSGMARIALAILLAWCAAGCAAIPLVPLGAAAVSGGANSLTRAGTEMTMGGGVVRTFTLPFDATHAAAYATLERVGVKIREEERTESAR